MKKIAILIVVLTFTRCDQPVSTAPQHSGYFEGSWVSDSKSGTFNHPVHISFIIKPDSSTTRVTFYEGSRYMTNDFDTWSYINDTLTLIDHDYAHMEKYAIKKIDDNTFEGYSPDLGMDWAVWLTYRRQ